MLCQALNMAYHIVNITPQQRTQAQDLELPRWKSKTAPPEGQFKSVYATSLDAIYTTDRTYYKSLKQKFTTREFISGVVYKPNLSKERHATGKAKTDPFETWHLVAKKK